MSNIDELISAIEKLPDGSMICSPASDGWDVDLTTDDLKALRLELIGLREMVEAATAIQFSPPIGILRYEDGSWVDWSSRKDLIDGTWPDALSAFQSLKGEGK